MTSANQKRIGEILCEEGFLSRPQLKDALEKQKKCKNRPLGLVLIDLWHITGEQLCDALLIQKRCRLSDEVVASTY